MVSMALSTRLILLLPLVWATPLFGPLEGPHLKMKRAVASLLEIDIEDSPPPPSRMSNVASRFMRKLYEEAAETGVMGTVRSIAPLIEKRGGDEVLVFPLNTLKLHDRLVKAELHVLGTKATKAARILSPEVIFNVEDTYGYALKVSNLDDDEVNWNVLKPLLLSFTNSSSLVIKMRRVDGRKTRRMVEFARRHSPFITVYTRNEEDDEAEDEEHGRRTKRDTGNFFAYDKEQAGRVEEGVDEYLARGPAILNTRVKQHKFSRRKYEKMKAKKPFWGFGDKYAEAEKEVGERLMRIGGENEEQERVAERRTLESTTAVNDKGEVDVVLLGGEEERHKVCSRQSLRVDFAEIGWSEWVIAPPSFEAGFCGGDCPFPLPKEARASNHALVQAALSSGLSSGLPAVCCAPDRMDSLTILYYDSNRNVMLKTFPRMVVQSCGCI